MQATNGVAASSGTSTDADGASSSKVSDAAGGPVVELPLHLTEKILCCISPLESARHATVCKSWASTVSARLAMPVPALFVCTAPDNKSDRRGFVVSVPLDGARSSSATIPSRVRSSDTIGLRCIGATPSGRVAFASSWWSRNVIFVNPITGVLESIDVGSPGHKARVLAGGAAGDALFAVDIGTLTLWRRAQGDGAWSRCAVTATLYHITYILSAVNSNGCFYLFHQDGCLYTVDTTSSSPPPLRMVKLPAASLLAQIDNQDDGRLLESDGEVLFVHQLPTYMGAAITVAGFEVYRLDLKEQRWTKVNRLAADRALFVSPRSSFAVRASEVGGCRSNCIYFVSEERNYAKSTSWGVYSMEDERVLFEHVVVTEPGRAVWFLPRVV